MREGDIQYAGAHNSIPTTRRVMIYRCRVDTNFARGGLTMLIKMRDLTLEQFKFLFRDA